jgi:hypothetical protein
MSAARRVLTNSKGYIKIVEIAPVAPPAARLPKKYFVLSVYGL